MLNTRALVVSTIIGTVLQVAMVMAGHTNKSIAALFAVGGMGFSLIAGVLYARLSGGGASSGPRLAFSTACTPTAIGSVSAACSVASASGTGSSSASVSRMYSA